MAATVLPMKSTPGALPSGPDWAYEVKWDGMRAVVRIDRGRATITSATGRDVTAAFPEIAHLAGAVPANSALLDGELVAIDDRGLPSFSLLQSRIHVRDPRAALDRAADVPVTLMLFDLLELEGRDLTELPWSDRRRLLEQLVEAGPHWQCPATFTDGAALLDVVSGNGMEGVVAKRKTSRYRAGTRSPDWIKVKVRRRQEFVVGGWATGNGSRRGRIGGLLLGVHDDDGGLRFVGRAGSGLDDLTIDLLQPRLSALATSECPFAAEPDAASARGASWVRPEIVVEVAFAEWTPDRRLRHPSIVGVRDDVDPSGVTERE